MAWSVQHVSSKHFLDNGKKEWPGHHTQKKSKWEIQVGPSGTISQIARRLRDNECNGYKNAMTRNTWTNMRGWPKILSSCRVKTATRQSCQPWTICLLGHRSLDQFLANRSCMVLWLYLGKDAGFIPATWKNHLQYLAMHLPRRELGRTLTFARHIALANELTVRKKIENRSPCFEQMQDSPQKMIVCAHAHQELESMTCRAHGLYRSIYMDIWKQSKLWYFICTTLCFSFWKVVLVQSHQTLFHGPGNQRCIENNMFTSQASCLTCTL